MAAHTASTGYTFNTHLKPYFAFSCFVLLRDFLFGRYLMDLNHNPLTVQLVNVLSTYTRYLISAIPFLSCTGSIKMVCTYGILHMAFYSLLKSYYWYKVSDLNRSSCSQSKCATITPHPVYLVGLGRIELPTSRLKVACSAD